MVRRHEAIKIRKDVLNKDYSHHFPIHHNNNEENEYKDEDGELNYIANYSKGLPHYTDMGNRKRGEVMPEAYVKLLDAIKYGDPSRFQQIPLANPIDPCARKLTNPQAGLAFDLETPDSHSFVIPPAPRIGPRPHAGVNEDNGEQASAEMAELYWMALNRDVNFNDYKNGVGLLDEAIDDLNVNYTYKIGPTDPLTRNSIFRGFLQGDLSGPYVSQFLLIGSNDPPLGRIPKNGYIKYGTLSIDQRQETPMKDMNFVTDLETWIQIQNGFEPRGMPDHDHPDMCKYDSNCGMQFDSPASDGRGRFIRNLRDLTNYVHFDDLPQEFLNACLILKHLGFPLRHGPPCSPQPHGPADEGNPYLEPNPDSKNQEGFGTFGDQYIFTLVSEVARRAIYNAWYHKWFIHRRLRPEAFGGLIHQKKTDSSLPYTINNDILNSQVLTKIQTKYGSYLLPQAYIEGSTMHPSYPSGHATIAGACVTILKAYFDESVRFADIPNLDVYVSNSEGIELEVYTGSDVNNITVGGELNKLASNIAIARNAAGIHYRSDYIQGILLGEKVAIGLLEEQLYTYNEKYSFTFTKFDGTLETIGN